MVNRPKLMHAEITMRKEKKLLDIADNGVEFTI